MIIIFSVIKVSIHFIANANYGFHADELYYIALSKHLQWGYLDNSPLIAYLIRFSELLFGESLFDYRIIPTLFSGFTIFIVGLITHQLGGKTVAIVIACLGMICSPAYLATGYFLQPVVFDQFFWTLGAFFLLRFLQTNKPINIYFLGATLGFGILNKYIILIYAFALFASAIFIRQKKPVAIKDILIAMFICFITVLPNLVWQIYYHLPIINYLQILKESNSFVGIGNFFFQFFLFHGSGIAIWLAGIIYVFLDQSKRQYSFLAKAFILTTLILVLLGGKTYYSLGAFPVLFAAGGACWESFLKKLWSIISYGFFAMIILPTLVAIPLVIPVLPFSYLLRYIKLMKDYTVISEPLVWDDGKIHQLPQFYADMFGWEELEEKVTEAYLKLNNDERKNAATLTNSYKIVGALSYYQTNIQPSIISPANSFLLWSPKSLSSDILIYVTDEDESTVKKLAYKAILTNRVMNQFSTVNGLKIYLIYQPREILKARYISQRQKFLN
ncbi:ArnT family glycosyltransferase [Pedobacter mucosus]|uniref:ArnT family glycosyltransferase n=1 Tax=Pedobacter mucosus TaxID=2895286 RepID=UPI001EE3B8AB|nr:glycosyltransferase family 39 protein [Pedobacter mucosus]UKT62603.1 glycosyltransferase family 39 protein [Pedobacter mucosus]